jgi:hypothetical protein
MVRPVSPASSDGPTRPPGVGLTALALCVLLAIDFLRALPPLAGGVPIGLSGIQPLLLCLVRALAFLILWQYWKGRDFARVFVLLWSLLAAARAISLLVEHNLDPAALMGRPLDFFQSLLAVFLLYWLNTPPLRAWFKKMSANQADLIAARLVGQLCTALDFHPPAPDVPSPAVELHSSAEPTAALYRLTFEHGAQLTLFCPFRIVLDDNLAFAYAPAAHAPAAGSKALPHAPAAGSEALPHPTAPAPDPSSDPDDARRLLQNLRVTAVRLAPHTTDLFLTFEMGIELQTWAHAPAAPAPAAGSVALPHAPAAGREALPPAPAAGSIALSATPAPDFSPQWTYSDPGLTVIARADGLRPRIVVSPASPAEPPANDEPSSLC